MEWGLRAPITPRLGGNCWALPRHGKIGAEGRKIKPTLNTKFRILPATDVHRFPQIFLTNPQPTQIGNSRGQLRNESLGFVRRKERKNSTSFWHRLAREFRFGVRGTCRQRHRVCLCVK